MTPLRTAATLFEKYKWLGCSIKFVSSVPATTAGSFMAAVAGAGVVEVPTNTFAPLDVTGTNMETFLLSYKGCRSMQIWEQMTIPVPIPNNGWFYTNPETQEPLKTIAATLLAGFNNSPGTLSTPGFVSVYMSGRCAFVGAKSATNADTEVETYLETGAAAVLQTDSGTSTQACVVSSSDNTVTGYSNIFVATPQNQWELIRISCQATAGSYVQFMTPLPDVETVGGGFVAPVYASVPNTVNPHYSIIYLYDLNADPIPYAGLRTLETAQTIVLDSDSYWVNVGTTPISKHSPFKRFMALQSRQTNLLGAAAKTAEKRMKTVESALACGSTERTSADVSATQISSDAKALVWMMEQMSVMQNQVRRLELALEEATKLTESEDEEDEETGLCQ
jgi:hypothetical protein